MRRPQTDHSHRVCPTCWSDISQKDFDDLAYFANNGGPLKNDDIMNRFEEILRLIGFLGALAQAGPLAAAQDAEAMESDPRLEWLIDLKWLAEELTEETQRRLLLLKEAGEIWERRAE